MTDNPEQNALPDMSQIPLATPTPVGQNERFTGRLIEVAAGAVTLLALFHLPTKPRGLVVLTHGIEGSVDGSHATALAIANGLHRSSLATLVVDLFSTGEQQLDQGTDYFRLNTSIMEQRIMGIAEWAQDNAETSNLSIGYFGAGATGTTVLIAAAERPDVVKAVVAVAARLDLAQGYLRRIMSPTMLLAAQRDTNAVQQNQQAMESLTQEKRFEQITGVSTPFSSQASIAQVAQLTGEWFVQHLEPIV